MINENEVRKEFQQELDRNESESYKEVMDFLHIFAVRKAGSNITLRDKLFRDLTDIAEEHLEERGLMDDESGRTLIQ